MIRRYPKQLDRMLATAIAQAKALFPEAADSKLSGMGWVVRALGETGRPVWALNRFCLEHKHNCPCLPRFDHHLRAPHCGITDYFTYKFVRESGV